MGHDFFQGRNVRPVQHAVTRNIRVDDRSDRATRYLFQQIDRAGQRIPLQPRWYQLDESMQGSRLLMSLAEPLDPALRGALAINLAPTDVAAWEELSAG